VEVLIQRLRGKLPVFESRILTKKRLEKEAAKIMGKKDSDWAYADDLLDKVERSGVFSQLALLHVWSDM
jgi:hypothetical protein